MSKKVAKKALETLLVLELNDRDKLDVLHIIKTETSSQYTKEAAEELIGEIKSRRNKG